MRDDKTPRDELREHLKTFYLYLVAESAEKITTGNLWLINPEEYGTTKTGAELWKAKGEGIERAAQLLLERFCL